jgi:tetratricopeptide (TPR) repeat protein
MKSCRALRAFSIAMLALIFLPAFLWAASAQEKTVKDRAQALYEEAADFNKQRRYDEAIDKLTQAINLSLDTHKYHQALHLTYIAIRRGPQAIQFYKNLIREHPKNGTVHYWLGRLYLEKGSLEEAALEFKEASLLAPEDEHAFLSMGHAYSRLGKDKEALEAYLQANKLTPKVAIIHIGLGNIYYKRKDYPKAQKEYEEALKLDGSFAEARYNLGLIYEKKGEISKAVKQWQKLIEDDPNESGARERLARLYFQAERYVDAVREYATLAQVKQHSPEVFFALGESSILAAATLHDQSDRDQLKKMASDAFQRTVELDPKNERARRYLARMNSQNAPSPQN